MYNEIARSTSPPRSFGRSLNSRLAEHRIVCVERILTNRIKRLIWYTRRIWYTKSSRRRMSKVGAIKIVSSNKRGYRMGKYRVYHNSMWFFEVHSSETVVSRKKTYVSLNFRLVFQTQSLPNFMIIFHNQPTFDHNRNKCVDAVECFLPEHHPALPS